MNVESDSDEGEIDGFEEALQLYSKSSESELEQLKKKKDDDFRRVNHDDCVYKQAVVLLENMDLDSLSNVWATIKGKEGLTPDERLFLESIEQTVLKSLPAVAKLAMSLLPVARDLEEEHLVRVERVSNTLTKEQMATAQLCYPVTRWNIEKYCWLLEYRSGIEKLIEINQTVSHLPEELKWLRQAVKRASLVTVIMWGYNRNDSWDIALSDLLEVPLPSSDEDRLQLKKDYERLKTSLAGAQAEVYFGRHEDFPGLHRDKVAGIAGNLEEAGHESMLDEIDLYSKRLIKTQLFDLTTVKTPYLVRGLAEKCKNIVLDPSTYKLAGIPARKKVIEEVGFDPYAARLADMIDETEQVGGPTMEEVAYRENVPVKDLYNFKRRLKYNKKKKRG